MTGAYPQKKKHTHKNVLRCKETGKQTGRSSRRLFEPSLREMATTLRSFPCRAESRPANTTSPSFHPSRPGTPKSQFRAAD
jgi:hypothetical protein